MIRPRFFGSGEEVFLHGPAQLLSSFSYPWRSQE
jgi:hypothetical protein